MDIVNGLTSILSEMWTIVMNVFGGADTVSLVIMLLVVVASGMLLQEMRINRIVQVTFWSLIVYGLLRLAYSVVKGADAMSLPTTAWTNLKVMSVGDLTVYFLAFAIVISAVHAIRSMVGSGGH
jgi:hypothetical protein